MTDHKFDEWDIFEMENDGSRHVVCIKCGFLFYTSLSTQWMDRHSNNFSTCEDHIVSKVLSE